MSTGAIIYLVVLLVIHVGGFGFFIFMDLKKHKGSNNKKPKEDETE